MSKLTNDQRFALAQEIASVIGRVKETPEGGERDEFKGQLRELTRQLWANSRRDERPELRV